MTVEYVLFLPFPLGGIHRLGFLESEEPSWPRPLESEEDACDLNIHQYHVRKSTMAGASSLSTARWPAARP